MRAWAQACLLVLAGAGDLRATEDERPVPEAIRDANNAVSLSAIERRVAYRESNGGLLAGAPDTLDTESGWLQGFLVEGRFQQRALGFTDLFVRARVALTWGDLDYDGGTQRDKQYVPIMGTSGASMTDVSLTVGAGIGMGKVAALTPLVGYGYRFWKRLLNDSGLGGYHEEYSSHELAAGAMAQVLLGDHLMVSVTGMVGGIFHASIYIQPVPAASLDLGPSLIFHGEVSLEYKLMTSPLVYMFGTYDICSFGFGRSGASMARGANIVEPDSDTLQHELRAGLVFGF